MIYSDILSSLDGAISDYVDRQIRRMQMGKYSYTDHWRDGYIAMLNETLYDQRPEDDYYPLSHHKVRKLIATFNKITYQKVPDIWVEDDYNNYHQEDVNFL
jgi:hypothetical protein